MKVFGMANEVIIISVECRTAHDQSLIHITHPLHTHNVGKNSAIHDTAVTGKEF